MLDELLQQIRACNVCEASLAFGVNPVVQACPESKIVIISQAPGLKVHQSNIPWNDASGDQLRNWLGVTKEQFYNPELFALIPMGFCYPGKAASGDLPPRKECAPLWHARLLSQMKNVALVLVIGRYAQNYYLKEKKYKTMTENIQHYNDFLPDYFPLPHPSPRNFIWMNKNQWFAEKVVPALKNKVAAIL
ncbi:MAG TPA: uracil-DNA glycosylase family protein [Flavobacterium sp.]|nr:uracil-DNA glycosylase family protein [Flavobacterium sp.]